MRYILPVVLLAGFAIFFSSCENDGIKSKFSRDAMLENYARDIIQPKSTAFRAAVTQLGSDVESLVAAPDAAKLATAQTAWDNAYQAWTKINSLNFGPGGTEGLRRTLREEMALWPIAVAELEAKILEEAPNLNDSKRSTRGLSVIEYLLFGEEGADVLAEMDDNRKSYLQGIMNKLQGQVADFDDAWQGAYAEEFIANNGVEVKSSVTQMYNEFVRSYERIKDVKIAVPFGTIAGLSAKPEQVEAPYSKKSLDYLLLHYATIVDLWHGTKENGEDGIGWEEYLLSVDGGEQLVNDTKAQFEKVDAVIQQLPQGTSLQQLAVEQNQTVLDLERELESLTRYLKGDLNSLLSIPVTASHLDGD